MKTYNYICSYCGKNGERIISNSPLRSCRKNPHKGDHFCNAECRAKFRIKKFQTTCAWCNSSIIKLPKDIRKTHSGRLFCNRSCAVSFNNTQKRKSRRSKCEILLVEMLKEKFNNLEILPNDKSILDGLECDIAIPSIKLLIEWNGIVHYSPIYGHEKLQTIQQNDREKLTIAKEKGFNLIVITDLVSTPVYVKECFLEIERIINQLLK